MTFHGELEKFPDDIRVPIAGIYWRNFRAPDYVDVNIFQLLLLQVLIRPYHYYGRHPLAGVDPLDPPPVGGAV